MPIRTRHWEEIAAAAQSGTGTVNGGGKHIENAVRVTVLSDVSVWTSGDVDVHIEVSDDGSTWFDLYIPEDSGNEQVAVQQQSAANKLALTFPVAAKYIRAVAVYGGTVDLTHGVEMIAHEEV